MNACASFYNLLCINQLLSKVLACQLLSLGLIGYQSTSVIVQRGCEEARNSAAVPINHSNQKVFLHEDILLEARKARAQRRKDLHTRDRSPPSHSEASSGGVESLSHDMHTDTGRYC